MEKFIIGIIEQMIKALMGGDVMATIEKMVDDLMNEDLTNDEKRTKVKEVVSPLLNDIAKFFLSSAIAFAVDSLKAELAERNGN